MGRARESATFQRGLSVVKTVRYRRSWIGPEAAPAAASWRLWGSMVRRRRCALATLACARSRRGSSCERRAKAGAGCGAGQRAPSVRRSLAEHFRRSSQQRGCRVGPSRFILRRQQKRSVAWAGVNASGVSTLRRAIAWTGMPSRRAHNTPISCRWVLGLCHHIMTHAQRPPGQQAAAEQPQVRATYRADVAAEQTQPTLQGARVEKAADRPPRRLGRARGPWMTLV